MTDQNETLKRIMTISLIISVFSLGFTSAYFIMLLDNPTEMPFSFSDSPSPTAPDNTITEKDIRIYDDKVVIYVKDASLSRYAPTGSMLPTLNEYSNGIKIVPDSESDINIGDIITFRSGSDHIVHRVIDKGVDREGTYFITKGDNNDINDGKVRFSDIESKTIALLY